MGWLLRRVRSVIPFWLAIYYLRGDRYDEQEEAAKINKEEPTAVVAFNIPFATHSLAHFQKEKKNKKKRFSTFFKHTVNVEKIGSS